MLLAALSLSEPQLLGRVRTRSFANATGSVTANDTPDRAQASRVNATGSNPGGSTPGDDEPRRDGARTSPCEAVYGRLLECLAMAFIPDRCDQQSTTSSIRPGLEVLYVLTQLNQGTRATPRPRPGYAAGSHRKITLACYHREGEPGVLIQHPRPARSGFTEKRRFPRSDGCVDSTPPRCTRIWGTTRPSIWRDQ